MKRPIAISGAVLITSGCFFPILHVMDNSLTFFDKVPASVPDVPPNTMLYAALFLCAMAALVVVLSLMGKTKFIWLAGVFSGLCLAAVYAGMHRKIEEMKEQADEQMSNLLGGMFKGLTNSLFESIEIRGSGWYIIAAGSILIIISSFFKTPIKTTPSDI